MPFNFLLANHLLSGTSSKESRVNVSIKPENGETILFFRLDSDGNRQLRKCLAIGDTGIICDLLIYHFSINNKKPKICLVEQKGKDISHAVKQIENVYDAFRKNLNAQSNIFDEFSWGAFIQTNKQCSVPHMGKQLLKPLEKKGLKCRVGKKDIDVFIRNIP